MKLLNFTFEGGRKKTTTKFQARSWRFRTGIRAAMKMY